jgi:dienelactone hydrolase
MAARLSIVHVLSTAIGQNAASQEGDPVDMSLQAIAYEADGVKMIGQLAVGSGPGKRPGILVAHESPGVTEHVTRVAERLADLGYAAFALDYQGGGVPVTDRAEMMRRFEAFMADPSHIRSRMRAALDVLTGQPAVNNERLAVIGYCYGGTAALELARSGADLKAVVGFHCGLATVRPQDGVNIKGKVLACIGADDPVVPAEQRAAFEQEMTSAKVDWRMNLYGGTGHSFTNPEADSWGMPGFAYNAQSDRRAWNAMLDLFAETLQT